MDLHANAKLGLAGRRELVLAIEQGSSLKAAANAFSVSPATAHRRFVAWTEAGVWRRLHRAVLDRLGGQGAIDWSRAIVDAASARAKKGAR